ncbi:MAG: hypothetical protein JNM20_06400 [Rhizobiales bacterium]|nr:hypothetical protein [Hyphomicrobiales bacterium]
MSIFSAMKDLFRPQPLASRAQLKDFLESRAAYLVQKSMMEYCQARANMLFSTLLGEADFRAAYEHARWHAYPFAYAMVTEMAEGLLRPLCAGRTLDLHAAFLGIAREIFGAFPLPPQADADFWQTALDTLDHDLGQAGLGPVKSWREIPDRHARRIFALLPIHDRLKSRDFSMFQNNLRFHLTEIGAEFEERADLQRLARDLLH